MKNKFIIVAAVGLMFTACQPKIEQVQYIKTKQLAAAQSYIIKEKLEIARAEIKIKPTPTPTLIPQITPQPVIEIIQEVDIEIIEPAPADYDQNTYYSDYPEQIETDNYYQNIPDQTNQTYQEPDMQYLGTHTITWYSWEACGNNMGAAYNQTGGLIPYYSCAMPSYDMLGAIIYIQNYGQFRVDDVSNGPVDLFVNYNSEIPSYGMDYQNVYLIGWAY